MKRVFKISHTRYNKKLYGTNQDSEDFNVINHDCGGHPTNTRCHSQKKLLQGESDDLSDDHLPTRSRSVPNLTPLRFRRMENKRQLSMPDFINKKHKDISNSDTSNIPQKSALVSALEVASRTPIKKTFNHPIMGQPTNVCLPPPTQDVLDTNYSPNKSECSISEEHGKPMLPLATEDMSDMMP